MTVNENIRETQQKVLALQWVMRVLTRSPVRQDRRSVTAALVLGP